MDHTQTASGADATVAEETPTVRLNNDVHFERSEPLASLDSTWAPFPRLPAELRLHVWLLCLQRYRMIELDLFAALDEEEDSYPGDASQWRYYTERNELGNIVSSRGYVLSAWSRLGLAAPLSPLFWVNSEARGVALGFYSVHLPFRGVHTGQQQVLYLNPEYDIVSPRPRQFELGDRTVRPDISLDTLVVDFLHDVKAYDCKGQGYVWKSLCGFTES
jgi:hypothetical protein